MKMVNTKCGEQLREMYKENTNLYEVGIGLLGAVRYARAAHVVECIDRNGGGAPAAIFYALGNIIKKLGPMKSAELVQINPKDVITMIAEENFDFDRCAKSPSGRKALEIAVAFANSFAGNGWPSIEGDPITVESLLPKQTKAEKANTYFRNLNSMYIGSERAIYGMIRNAVNCISKMPIEQSEKLTGKDIDKMVRTFGYVEWRCEQKLINIMQDFIALFD
jgi:hypothetical protein